MVCQWLLILCLYNARLFQCWKVLVLFNIDTILCKYKSKYSVKKYEFRIKICIY